MKKAALNAELNGEMSALREDARRERRRSTGLHDRLQELLGGFRVVCRLKPPALPTTASTVHVAPGEALVTDTRGYVVPGAPPLRFRLDVRIVKVAHKSVISFARSSFPD